MDTVDKLLEYLEFEIGKYDKEISTDSFTMLHRAFLHGKLEALRSIKNIIQTLCRTEKSKCTGESKSMRETMSEENALILVAELQRATMLLEKLEQDLSGIAGPAVLSALRRQIALGIKRIKAYPVLDRVSPWSGNYSIEKNGQLLPLLQCKERNIEVKPRLYETAEDAWRDIADFDGCWDGWDGPLRVVKLVDSMESATHD